VKAIYLLLFCFTLSPAIRAQTINGFYSTPVEKFAKAKTVKLAAGGKQPDITIYPDQPLQRIDGFGACFNELGWEALLSLPEDKRNKIIEDLFSEEGMNFSWGRMPLGSNDYSLSYYSYNDVPEDFEMKNFNIDRDRYILVPYIKAAKKVRLGLKIWASPWSPPAWMKVNNHYAMGAYNGVKTIDKGRHIAKNATAFKMENRYLEGYALYCSKFVQAYKNEGIDISLVMVQNEPVYQPQWQSCTWRPEDLAFFIGNYLGPRFRKDSISTTIWLGTVNSGDPGFTRTILNNKEAAPYVKGLGVQWDFKYAIEAIHKEYPDLTVMQTESVCGNGENNWQSAEYTWSLIQRYLINGANSYMYWNMVLDSSGMSTWGWKQNMMISINKRTAAVTYNPEYYLMKHISHFVQPGARLLKTPGVNDLLAFLNPDRQVIIILMNRGEQGKEITIAFGGKNATLETKAKSMNTFVINTAEK